MSTAPDVPGSDARAHRRWLIGIGITVVFGIFGAIMALLAYTKISAPAARRAGAAVTRPAKASTATPTPTPDAMTTPATEPTQDDGKHGKGHRAD